MCSENQYARIVSKVGSGLPTVPVSASHNNGDWLATDIYEGELYIDSDTGKIYTRLASGIVDIGVVSSANIYNTDGTLTGNRIVDQDGNTLTFQNGDFAVINSGSTFNMTNGYIELANVQGVSDNVTMSSVAGGSNNYLVINSDKGENTGQLITGSHGTSMLYLNSTTLKQSSIGLDNLGNASVSSSDGSVMHKLNITDTGATISYNGVTYMAFRGAAHTSSILDITSTTKGALPVPRLTEVERDAIASPADYLEIVNTTRERKEIYRPFWGWHPVGTITPDWGYWWLDEASGTNGEFVFSATNGGTSTTLIDATISPTRLIGLSTGVNTNGEYRQITGPYLLGSTGLKSWETKVSFDSLSDATNRYVARSGYVNNSAGLSASIGMYFLYDEGGVYGTATASANWLCVCFTSGSPTIVDSGVPVTTSPTNQLQKLQILDSGTGSSVYFYIDNILVATITTQIPTNSQTLSAGNIITKQAGTTARIMYDDYVSAKEKFNTPR